MKINFVDLKAQYNPYLEEVMNKVKNILETTSFVGGKYLEEFENKVARFNNSKYCIGVGSGTDALLLTLLAYGIGSDDEVIVPANTFIATAFAVTHTGADVVFVDVDPDTYLIDLTSLFKAITPKTKAIIPVHLYGQMCDIQAIKGIIAGRDIKIIEDCAQAFGGLYLNNRPGYFGDAGCFSFYPSKNLGGLGQGGCVVTNDAELANKIRSFGDVGRSLTDKYKHELVGFNSRLDTINAAFLGVMIDHVDEWNANRYFVARQYNLLLKSVPEVKTPAEDKNALHIYHLYELKCRNKDERDALFQFLLNKGIGVGLHYPIPCHKQPMYKHLGYKLPICEELCDTLLSLPMHPNLLVDDIMYVIKSIREFYGRV